ARRERTGRKLATLRQTCTTHPLFEAGNMAGGALTSDRKWLATSTSSTLGHRKKENEQHTDRHRTIANPPQKNGRSGGCHLHHGGNLFTIFPERSDASLCLSPSGTRPF
ncbi:unnamed protein product, partial [Ectocarpus sp. 8 AP-2014]